MTSYAGIQCDVCHTVRESSTGMASPAIVRFGAARDGWRTFKRETGLPYPRQQTVTGDLCPKHAGMTAAERRERGIDRIHRTPPSSGETHA